MDAKSIAKLLSDPCPYGESCRLSECDPYCAHECDIRSRAWKAVEDGLPDDEIIVIVHVADESEPVWLGYMDEDAEWRYITGGRCHATHWMDMPKPPVSVPSAG